MKYPSYRTRNRSVLRVRLGATEQENKSSGNIWPTSTGLLLTCYLALWFTPTMNVGRRGSRKAERPGKRRTKEGRWRGIVNEGRVGTRTQTVTLHLCRCDILAVSAVLFAHARGIHLKRKSEVPLPAHKPHRLVASPSVARRRRRIAFPGTLAQSRYGSLVLPASLSASLVVISRGNHPDIAFGTSRFE